MDTFLSFFIAPSSVHLFFYVKVGVRFSRHSMKKETNIRDNVLCEMMIICVIDWVTRQVDNFLVKRPL